MRVDSHQHFWRLARGDYGWLTPELGAIHRDFGPADLAPFLKRHRVEGTVLVQAAATRAETEFMLGVAHASPMVLGVVGWVDFESPAATREIAQLARDPLLKSLRPMVQDIADPRWLARADLDPVFDALVAADLAFDALVKPAQLPALVERLDRTPDLRTVLDHGGKPSIRDRAFDDWARAVDAVAAFPHVHCKLSGLVTEAQAGWTVDTVRPYAQHLLSVFGAERLMFGSDWPVVNLNGSYNAWLWCAEALASHLAPEDFQRVFGDTAARFYRLEPREGA